ncbi:MAG: hypothetical protein R3D70_23000 [Rhizobiaceae bacterium]
MPHCNGMGHRYPRAMAEMRGVKSEGGCVVNTEECSSTRPATFAMANARCGCGTIRTCLQMSWWSKRFTNMDRSGKHPAFVHNGMCPSPTTTLGCSR